MFQNNSSLQQMYNAVQMHGTPVSGGWIIEVGQPVLQIPSIDLARLNYVLEANQIATIPPFSVNRQGDITELLPFLYGWVGEKRLKKKNKANNSSTLLEYLNTWARPFSQKSMLDLEERLPLFIGRDFVQRNHQWRAGSSCWFSENQRWSNRSMVSLGNDYGQGFWIGLVARERATNQDIVVEPVFRYKGNDYYPAGRAWCHPSKDGWIVFNAKAVLNNLPESLKGLHKLSTAFAQWLSETTGLDYQAQKRKSSGYNQRGGSVYVDNGMFYEIGIGIKSDEKENLSLEGPVYHVVWQCPLTYERYPTKMWGLSGDGFPVAVDDPSTAVAAFHSSGQPWTEWVTDNLDRVEEVQNSEPYKRWRYEIPYTSSLVTFNRSMRHGKFKWDRNGSELTRLMYQIGHDHGRHFKWSEEILRQWHDRDWDNVPSPNAQGVGRTITFNAFLYFLERTGLWAEGL